MNGTTSKGVGALTVVLSVIGGVALLGTGAGAAWAGAHSVGPRSGELQESVAGVTALDVEVSGAEMEVEFADVAEAELRVEGGSPGGWSLRRDGDELEVRGPQNRFDWFRPDWLRGDQRATLVLPLELEGLDGELTLDAGELTVEGDFDVLNVEVNAGSLEIEGEARMLEAELNAGRADIALSGVDEAGYTVSAGRIVSTLHTAPSSVTIAVMAGALDLSLPDEGYDLRQQLSAGSLDNGLTQRSSSDRRIVAEVEAGSVNLRPIRD